MEIKINDRYTLTGTPAEMAILMILMDTPEIEEQQKKEQTGQDPEQVAPVTIQTVTTPAVVETPAEQKPTPKKARKAPTPDWGKARALRNAGWTLKEIARELHVSPQTVANHLGGKIDDE